MKVYISIFMFIVVFLLSPLPVMAKSVLDSKISTEKRIINNQVNEFIVEFFDDFENKRTEKIAWMIVEGIGYAWDETKKEESRKEYKANLDKIFIEPPNGKYGQYYGYNLISSSFLPGSNRYLRLYYISYHSGAPLVWEFRFYIRPKGELSLNQVFWSEKNPFECLSTLDLIFEELKKINELLTLIRDSS